MDFILKLCMELFSTPILLIIFNRPELSQKVFDVIRTVKPQKLYISADGPRLNNHQDKINCEHTRQIIKQVDWDCKLFTRFLETNLGCGLNVSSAISWAFEKEDRLIILEDDTVPAIPFFSYCNSLLEKYKDDTRICMISGNNYTEIHNVTEDSYFFSIYGHIWGWATWKRVWVKYDFEMRDWPLFKNTNQINNVFSKKSEQHFFLTFYNNFFKLKDKGTWDYQWFYCRIKEMGLSIVPQNNLVTNIGVQGVHTTSKSKAHFSPANEDFRISKEPQFILRNTIYDMYHFKKHINQKTPLYASLFIKVGKTIKNIFFKPA